MTILIAGRPARTLLTRCEGSQRWREANDVHESHAKQLECPHPMKSGGPREASPGMLL